jgi:hypothetical protein
MDKTNEFLALATKEMIEDSTVAGKIAKLKPKFSILANAQQRQAIRSELWAKIQQNQLAPVLQQNRFAIALPFWGVGGLGLLLGISTETPLDFIATAVAFPLAILIQKIGFELETMNLVIATIDEIEAEN